MTEATHPATVPPWTLGDRLRKAREFAGLKQTEMAAEIGIGRSSIINYENDQQEPPRPVLVAWALRCGVDYEWLTGEPVFRPRGGRFTHPSTSALTFTFADGPFPLALAA